MDVLSITVETLFPNEAERSVLKERNIGNCDTVGADQFKGSRVCRVR